MKYIFTKDSLEFTLKYMNLLCVHEYTKRNFKFYANFEISWMNHIF